MKEDFVKYLESIGITKAFRKRIETIYGFYREICPDEITGIFITDYVKQDGEREYENLWFFSEKYVMEAKRFITEDDFDITTIHKRIDYLTIKKQDYDFKEATEKSRLHLLFTPGITTSAEFKASKENCDYFKGIFLKYIVPNLKE